MMTDPISDFLTRIRNALVMKHKAVRLPSSKMKLRIAQILMDEGYINDFRHEADGKQGILHVDLRYDGKGLPVIEGLQRVSRPGLRVYKGSTDIPKVRGGIGMAVVSTSRGVMPDHQARRENVGGEVLCYVW
jgi:small subunit ribosomal protein S8